MDINFTGVEIQYKQFFKRSSFSFCMARKPLALKYYSVIVKLGTVLRHVCPAESKSATTYCLLDMYTERQPMTRNEDSSNIIGSSLESWIRVIRDAQA